MSKKILTLNIGASSVALAEYEGGAGGSLTLVNYGMAMLAAPIDTGDAGAILTPALMEIVREKGISPGKVAVALPGQMVFPRCTAITKVGGADKFEQHVRYEIEQNVPFPIDEMVCDYQELGETASGDSSVLVVAAKVEQVEAVTSALQAAGFEPMMVDVTPIALTNVLRAVRPDEGCAVILDIGARTTSLVISEGEKLYNRSIPVAGNSVTKEISQALGCSLEEAEGYKRESAYVSLGGVTEDEDETLDRISKVCRAVMTRLHAEISRSINFYRSQQGGSAPTKLFLTGGSALLPQLDEFFRQSLDIEVEYLNPFEAVGTGPAVDVEALGTDTAFISPTVGVALHAAKAAAIAIDLMPPSIIEARAEVARIPFVAVGALSLIAALVCFWLMADRELQVVDEKIAVIDSKSGSLKRYDAQIKEAQNKATEAADEAAALRDLLAKRSVSIDRVNAVRQALGSDFWIHSWTAKGEVTVRAWSDRFDAFRAKAAEKSGQKREPTEIIRERLLANPMLEAESVDTKGWQPIGKDNCLQQFVIVIKYKEGKGK